MICLDVSFNLLIVSRLYHGVESHYHKVMGNPKIFSCLDVGIAGFPEISNNCLRRRR